MDEEGVLGDLGEGVDPRLGDVEPAGDADFLSLLILEFGKIDVTGIVVAH